jgi:hypothetical protein
MAFVTAASDALFERLKNHVRAQRLYQALIDRNCSFGRGCCWLFLQALFITASVPTVTSTMMAALIASAVPRFYVVP